MRGSVHGILVHLQENKNNPNTNRQRLFLLRLSITTASALIICVLQMFKTRQETTKLDFRYALLKVGMVKLEADHP